MKRQHKNTRLYKFIAEKYGYVRIFVIEAEKFCNANLFDKATISTLYTWLRGDCRPMHAEQLKKWNTICEYMHKKHGLNVDFSWIAPEKDEDSTKIQKKQPIGFIKKPYLEIDFPEEEEKPDYDAIGKAFDTLTNYFVKLFTR